jgi:hypothetical protein
MSGRKACANTNSAPRLPFANTWPQSRRLPFENFSFIPAFRRAKVLDNRLEEIKNVNSSNAQGHPPKPKISPPLRAAAQAPLRLNAPTRQATKEINIPRLNPMMSWIDAGVTILNNPVDNSRIPVDKCVF